MQSLSMTLQQYANDIIAKSFKVADVYDKTKLNPVFIDDIDSSIWHSLRNFCATHLQDDLTDIAFHAKSLPALQKRSRKHPTNIQQQTRLQKPYTRKPWKNRRGPNNANTDTTSTPTRSLWQQSKSRLAINLNLPSA